MLLALGAALSVGALRARRRRRGGGACAAVALDDGDVEEAVSWIRTRLSGDVGSLLSAEDVRRIVNWNLEYFRSRSASGNGHGAASDASVVVAGAETVEYVMSRADEVGARYTPAQVHAVLEAQVSYLASIGALGGGPQA